MAPDYDPFSGSVSFDGAELVMREIISPTPVRLRRIPDRATGPSFAPVPYRPAE